MRACVYVCCSEEELMKLAEQLYQDSKEAMQQAAYVLVKEQIERGEDDPDRDPPGPLELSVVLSDDAYIQELNKEWRNVDTPTDVLSFEMGVESEVTLQMPDGQGDCEIECALPWVDGEEKEEEDAEQQQEEKEEVEEEEDKETDCQSRFWATLSSR